MCGRTGLVLRAHMFYLLMCCEFAERLPCRRSVVKKKQTWERYKELCAITEIIEITNDEESRLECCLWAQEYR